MTPPALAPTTSRTLAAERLSGRLLIGITYLSVILLLIGVALMVRDGISPLDGGPGLDLATLGATLAALEPVGFLWLGLLVVIAAPICRVIVAGIAYARDGDWLMVGISVAILAVIAVGVGSALIVRA
jgi:uncharacterized membrane protein